MSTQVPVEQGEEKATDRVIVRIIPPRFLKKSFYNKSSEK